LRLLTKKRLIKLWMQHSLILITTTQYAINISVVQHN